jgi:hypothetical protein
MFRVLLAIVTVLALYSVMNADPPQSKDEMPDSVPTVAAADYYGCYYCVYYRRAHYHPWVKYGCTEDEGAAERVA